MKCFYERQRVRVSKSTFAEMVGKSGLVQQLRFQDEGAWVEIEGPIPEALRCFNDVRRRNWVLLYPSQCEPERKAN